MAILSPPPQAGYAGEALRQATRSLARTDALLNDAVHAENRGDLAAARAGYRHVLTFSPLHEHAYLRLLALEGDQPPARDSDPFRRARAALPDRFTIHETARFVVLSDTDTAWTLLQVQRLERAYHQFERFARRENLKPLPLRHKLLCILFDDSAAYRRFAAAQDELCAGWTAGHYSTQNDWIVFYNPDTNPSVSEARAQLAEMGDRVEDVRRQAASARAAGRGDRARELDQLHATYRDHLKAELHRVNAFAAETGTVTTIHEAVHMLLFHRNIQSARVQYPIWISEGLATNFETNLPDEAFGPDRDFADRRQQFQSLLRDEVLLPLQALISITDLPHDKEAARVVYPQSYALVHWLYLRRRDSLINYINAMRRSSDVQMTPARHLATFEECFGDVASIERAWLTEENASFP